MKKSQGPRFGQPNERNAFKAIPMLLLALMPWVCTGLGIWQLGRLRWKVELIDDLRDKLQRAPMMLPRNVKFVFLSV